MAMDVTVNPRARYAGCVAPLCWISVVLGAADHIGGRRARR
jgi:hypothetical protein